MIVGVRANKQRYTNVLKAVRPLRFSHLGRNIFQYICYEF